MESKRKNVRIMLGMLRQDQAKLRAARLVARPGSMTARRNLLAGASAPAGAVTMPRMCLVSVSASDTLNLLWQNATGRITDGCLDFSGV